MRAEAERIAVERADLERVLAAVVRPAIAVSGGVDSVTLAVVAAHVRPDIAVYHAASPAVPAEATARVRRLADEHGWTLTVVDAGEFADAAYRANPVNRCFHCKTNLYRTIRAYTDRQILSGANVDDLGEYRPGLDAARRHGVRHPYVETGLTKAHVRQIARSFGLHGVAELPASPCLSSRVETGIRIEASTLTFVHDVEELVTRALSPGTVRCRVRANAIVIELDAPTLAALSHPERDRLVNDIAAQPLRPGTLPIAFAEYRNGSAFLVERT